MTTTSAQEARLDGGHTTTDAVASATIGASIPAASKNGQGPFDSNNLTASQAPALSADKEHAPPLPAITIVSAHLETHFAPVTTPSPAQQISDAVAKQMPPQTPPDLHFRMSRM
jgi:hypothetical protein